MTEAARGRLDLLLLAALAGGPAHGYAVIDRLRERSDGVFDFPEGTIYPALHRLEEQGWIDAEWGVSENNRRAKFYRLTAAGQKQLARETQSWLQFTQAVHWILQTL